MQSSSIRHLIPNPTNNERQNMIMNSLIKKNRLCDFQSIVKLLSPPPDITSFGVPGEFKGVKVGIIGGGLAGLSAAFELRKLGFDVTIIEAKRNRIGGRVYTYYFNMELCGLSFAAISLIINMLPMIGAVLYNEYGESLIEEYSLNFMNMYQIAGGTANLPLAFYNSLSSQYPKEYTNIPMNALGKFTKTG